MYTMMAQKVLLSILMMQLDLNNLFTLLDCFLTLVFLLEVSTMDFKMEHLLYLYLVDASV